MRCILILMPLLILFLAPVLLSADTSFADLLYNQKDYQGSILEYKRVLHLGQLSYPDSVYAARQIVYALFLNNDLPELRKFVAQNQGLLAEDEFGPKLSALADIRQGYYYFAVRGLAEAKMPESLILRSLANQFMKQTQEANEDLVRASNYALTDHTLLDKAFFIESDLEKLPQKSPLLAGTLAVIPGAGYAYTGRWETALSSLLINGMLIMASAELYRNDLLWTAGILSSVTLGFYIGNIYGSAAAAAKDNFETRRRYLEGFIELNSAALLSLDAPSL